MNQSAQEWLRSTLESGEPPVFGRTDPVDPALARELERAGALARLPGEIMVVHRPGDTMDEVGRVLYWPIVAKLLENYRPSVVERDSAVRLLVGEETPPGSLRVRNGRNASRFEIEVAPGMRIKVSPGEVDAETARRHRVGEADILLDEPARILLGLEVRFLRDHLEEAGIWLRSLVLSRAALEAAYLRQPRPVVLRRLAHIAEDVGNAQLGQQLAEVIRTNQNVRIGRDRTGVGSELLVPTRVTANPTTRRPWLDRLNVQMETFRGQIEEVSAEFPIEASTDPLTDLLAGARAEKTYDTYHSTSIEGYRVRYEDVSVLLGGTPEGSLPEGEIRERMAVLGYSMAFDGLLERIAREGRPIRPSTNLLLDLYVDLFRPSVEAGIVEEGALRGWRTTPVFIRNSRFVPPGPERVGEMMDLFMERLSQLSNPVVSAILGHLVFVTIHPFPDGNGRIGRLLMNAILLSNGFPWLTIREDERGPYFQCLEKAHLEQDARPFGHFIMERLVRVGR